MFTAGGLAMQTFAHTAFTTRLRKASFALSLLGAATGLATVADAQMMPPDAQPTCTVPATTFARWFAAGHPGLNQNVDPANSITFPHDNNCGFYAWSHQMFLWLMSPAPSAYGGRGRIFNSPVFYDVSTPDAQGKRHFIPHVERPIAFPLGTAKVGTNGLPVLIDRLGRPREVIDAPVSAAGNATILVAGKPVEIRSITAGPDGKAQLADRTGKPINATVTLTTAIIPKALIAPQSRALLLGGQRLTSDTARLQFVLAKLRKASVLERFAIGGKFAFVDLGTGAVVDVDPVQAGHAADVLLAQNGSVIFYQTVVNDVYAYFLTMNQGVTTPLQFPTSQAQATTISQYARMHGKIIVDPEALAIEAKLAWVEVTAALPNPSSYITTQAIIPVYDTSDAHKWKPVSSKVATLALIGVHVVGSTDGHPEMLWATFEHFGNTPPATYQYDSTTGTKTVTQSTAGTWLLSASGSSGPFNVSHADYLHAPDIESTAGFSISPSDTLRWKPFGTPAGLAFPNPEDATSSAANTELISLNNNIAAMMAAGGAAADVRNNYFQTGTTWTEGGAPPDGPYPLPSGTFAHGNEVGTSFLANSTMETYHQGSDSGTTGMNCFFCHQSNTTSVSHMYPVLQPLF